jgi:hypothetical protein
MTSPFDPSKSNRVPLTPRHLYFVDHHRGSFAIARLDLKDEQPALRRYRPDKGAKTAPDAPPFGVASERLERDRIYRSGYPMQAGAPGDNVIVSDGHPEFGPPLPLSPVQTSPVPGRASGDAR